MATITSRSGKRYRLYRRSIPVGLVEAEWEGVRPGVAGPLAMAGRGRPLYSASDLYDWVPLIQVLSTAREIVAGARQRQERARRRKDTSPDCPFATFKEARRAGYIRLRPEHYGGHKIRLKGHDLVRDPQCAQSRTAWAKEGKTVKDGERPHAQSFAYVGKGIRYSVFRDDQVI